MACAFGNLETVQELLKRGARVCSDDHFVDHPLVIAVVSQKQQAMAIVKLLLDECKATDIVPVLPQVLFYALLLDCWDIAELLLRHNVNVNARFCHTPMIMHMINQRKPNSVRFLLQKEANLNVHGLSGSTPLTMSIRAGETEIAQELIQNGADVSMPDTEGNSPLWLSYKYGNMHIFYVLLRKSPLVWPDLNEVFCHRSG